MDSVFLAAVVAGLASARGFPHAPEDACPACAPYWQQVADVLRALKIEIQCLHTHVARLERAYSVMARHDEAASAPRGSGWGRHISCNDGSSKCPDGRG